MRATKRHENRRIETEWGMKFDFDSPQMPYMDKSKLPDRNPLHAEALDVADLALDLRIEVYNVRNHKPVDVGIIRSAPFLKVDEWGCEASKILLEVPNDAVIQEVRLADMGIIPHGNERDGLYRWDDLRYTLRVE